MNTSLHLFSHKDLLSICSMPSPGLDPGVPAGNKGDVGPATKEMSPLL